MSTDTPSNRFRKKPVVIEAEQFHQHLDRLPFSDDGDPVEYDEDARKHYVASLEGPHWVSDGDWIIRGVKGEYYAYKPDIFYATYEAAYLKESASSEMATRVNEEQQAMVDDATLAPVSAIETPDEDGERYRWFRDECDADRQAEIVEAAEGQADMLDHHIDKGRCCL